MLSANSKQRSSRIALVDCNNFYSSCERVFQPKWEGRPIAVLSNNDGCIVARSDELKALGIPMGAPYFRWKDRLAHHQAIVVSSNYALYGDMSARVMNTLGRFTPEMEIYSIDEAWLNLSGFRAETLDAYGRGIVQTVKQWTGIPVSMGIAPTRVLAKIANRIAKQRRIPGGVFNLGGAEALDTVLKTIEVEDIWGVGRRWGKQLRLLGIGTALQLRDADIEMIHKHFNVVLLRIVMELRGESCITADEIAPKKQIICSRSFGQRVTSLVHLKEAIATRVTRAAEKLRGQQSVCGYVQVFIRTGLFNPNEPTYSNQASTVFPVPTSDSRSLICGAFQALQSIYRKGYRYAKAGVILMDLSPAASRQMNLFTPFDHGRSQLLMEAVDNINHRFGQGTVFFGSTGTKNCWAMKRQKTTPAYTTRWSDLMVVS